MKKLVVLFGIILVSLSCNNLDNRSYSTPSFNPYIDVVNTTGYYVCIQLDNEYSWICNPNSSGTATLTSSGQYYMQVSYCTMNSSGQYVKKKTYYKTVTFQMGVSYKLYCTDINSTPNLTNN